jgi:hypothetical protein
MKLTNIAQSTVSLVLFTLAGAGAVLAAEPAADAQELARALLTGQRTSSAEFPKSTSAALDAQEQARRMLLGGAAKPDSRPAADAQDQASTSAAVDAQEQARRMLLGGAGKPNSSPAAVKLTDPVIARSVAL